MYKNWKNIILEIFKNQESRKKLFFMIQTSIKNIDNFFQSSFELLAEHIKVLPRILNPPR